jgi:hypothetical protein
MFNPSQSDVRNFFFDTYAKSKQQQALNDLEKIALSIIFEHPEYEKILSNKEQYFDYQWLPENGETNPFLHMSMHMSIIEQLSINQPHGIITLYKELYKKFEGEHKAQHELMDCIAEMIWQAQKSSTAPDPEVYFACINSKL